MDELIMDQGTAAYRLDRKSSVRFCLRVFFDLMDIAYVNSYIIYNMKHPNKLSLLDYKIVVTKNIIQYHEDQRCQDHLRARTNLNRLIIMVDIYQITKQCKNDARTVQ